MQRIIRQAEAADVPVLLDLYRELHPSDPPVEPATAARVWTEITAQSGRTILVAAQGDTLAGTVDCLVVPNLTRSSRPFMVIENVVVAAAARREGTGAALMAAATALAKESNCYKIQLLTAAKRGAAHTFYEACGFHPMAQGFRLYLP
jgi:N-acetylglutamate synthase-like GNAT family acetyltransferase